MRRFKVPSVLLAAGMIFISQVSAKAGCNVQENLESLRNIRIALTIYYGDTEGVYPKRLKDLVPRYLVEVPSVTPCDDSGEHHPASSEEHHFFSINEADDQGGWGYISDRSSRQWGDVFINCVHSSPKGKAWLKY